MNRIVSLERHRLGPRVYVLGCRVHEYQLGLVVLAASTVAFFAGAALLVPWPPVAALAGLWLIVKDWPDLFPATRDTASWRVGVHRLPEVKETVDRHRRQL